MAVGKGKAFKGFGMQELNSILLSRALSGPKHSDIVIFLKCQAEVRAPSVARVGCELWN